MTDNYIQLKKNKDILRLGIKTEDGIDTGEYLEFDLEDIELPLRFQELLEQDKKNKEHLRNQILIIDKKEDVKGKKLLSRNEEMKMKALKDFFEKEKEIYNGFLGDRGVEKLLNGEKLGWTSLQYIDDIIGEQIVPKLDITMESVTKKIKQKYSIKNNKENVLTNE